MKNRRLLPPDRHPSTLIPLWWLTGCLEISKVVLYVLVPLWLYHNTHSPAKVALVPIADMLGVILTGFLGGGLADRFPHSSIAGAAMVAMGLMIAAIIPGHLAWWLILLWALAIHSVYRFMSVARTVMINRVARDDLVAANTTMGTIFAGTKLGGAVLASGYFIVGYRGALIMALVVQIGLVLSAFITASPPGPSAAQSIRRVGKCKPAMPQALAQKALRGGVLFFALFITANAINASLFYIFLIRVVHAASTLFPLAMISQALGNIVVARTVGKLNRRWPASWVTCGAVSLIASSEFVYLAIPQGWLVLVLTFFVGMGTQVAVITAQTTFQQQAHPTQVGRALGVRASLANGLGMGGSFLASMLVRHVSAQPILLGSLVLWAMAAGVGLRAMAPTRGALS